MGKEEKYLTDKRHDRRKGKNERETYDRDLEKKRKKKLKGQRTITIHKISHPIAVAEGMAE